MTDDVVLAPIVARCARYILAHPRHGVSHLELREQFAEYRRLGHDDRLRLDVQLCKDAEISVLVSARRVYFYSRSEAPDGAFNIEEARIVNVIVRRCYRFIQIAGDERGVTPATLAQKVDVYRDAGLGDREQVHEMLAKLPGIAHTNRAEGWRFWPRQYAPEEAIRGV